MTTRKIKDAKDLSINELIYFKGHAQATYLSDGRTVEEAIPTKFSDLENDQSLVNQFQLATINGQSLVNDGQDIVIGGSSDVTVPTKTSELTNDSGFITIDDVPEVEVPTKTSELTNDSGFITIDDVPEVEVPTKTSDLTNDSGFVTSADNIASATKIQTTRYINGVGFDGTRDICNYAVCGTTASTATKDVTVNSDFNLQRGAKVTVKFNFPNTNSSPKLNVNSTGGRTMRYKGVNISNSFTFNGEALYTFTYDGTYWVLEGDWDSINKQDTLVSGTNIKTINGASILGSGNITIEGGGNTVDTSSFATKETVMTDEIAVNADGFTTTNGKWFALPGTDSENNSDYCIATFDDIPTTTSELENNSGFITINDVDVPTKTSELTNDSGFITSADIPEVTVPTKTSDLTNDSGFVTSADNIASATKLQTTRYINGVGFDGTKDIYNYVVCGTSASTATKTATVNSDFKLQSGSKVTVRFNFPNTNTTPTLNVNSTGAKRMKYKGNYISNSFVFNSEALYTFIYDGSNWVLEGDWDSITSDTISDWGFTKNIGTITGITMNGASKGTSGVVDLGTVVTAHQTLKTINNKSILGTGDITINTSECNNDSNFVTSADNIASATKLQTTRYINGIPFDGTSNITNYATCSTGATVREKAVNPITENFSLDEGSKITVKFTYANNAQNPGLNVANTGAKAIQYRGSNLQSTQYWAAGDVVDFVYDGSTWQVIGPINDNVGSGSSSDTKVTQTVTSTNSTNSTYPLLFSATANKTTTSDDTARFSSNLKYNPSTDTLTVANISGNASSATTATNANTLNTLNCIDGVNFTGASDVTHYVTCTNAGSTTAKTVTLNGFKLVTGARVSIKFSYAQTNATTGRAMTLKVGNTTAKGMYYKTLPLNGSNLPFKTGVIYDFIYDGTYWRLQGDWDAQIHDQSFDFSVRKAQFADQLTTPRTINGVSFDGSSNIEIDTTHIGKEHNAVIYFTGPARGNSSSEYEFHTTDGTLINPRGIAGGIAYLLYNENVVSQAIPLNHVFTGNFFPIKVSTVLTSASGNINTWTDAYIKCGIIPAGPIVYSIHLSDTNRTDVTNINLDNCKLEGHVYGIF